MNSLQQKVQELIDTGSMDEAQTLLQKSLKEEKTKDTCFALAEMNFSRKHYNDAVYYYEETIKLDPSFHQAYARIAEALLLNGHPFEALDYYGLAIKHGPDELGYKQGFVNLVWRLQLKAFNADLKDMVLKCLQTPALDLTYMGQIWQGLLRYDPVFKDVYKAGQKDDYDDFRKALSRLKDHKPLFEPFFLLGLRRLTVFDVGFEKFLTFLRRFVLDELQAKPEYRPLAEALSLYCLATEYVFFVSDVEKEKLKQVGDDAVLRACYQPLFKQADAALLKAKLSADLVDSHFTEFEKQAAVRPGIAVLNIEDEVSLKVRAQYEEFPYPRWRHFDSTIRSEISEGYLREGSPQILVAGCGTGREAIELAAVFPNAQVLAVDLSLTSLSYAVMKAQEFDIKNIEFRQADILKLGALDKKFDYIACSGVLHHMKEPKEGMAVLSGLLNPGGAMRIALYSELARQEIVTARAVIAEKGYSSDADGIRQFRHDAKGLLRLPTYADISSFADYYYLSECRDLLFHVQEHRYDINGIQDLLQSFKLEFSEFYLPGDILAGYHKEFPQEESVADLSNWAKFEARNPKTFREMYRFWVRKAA